MSDIVTGKVFVDGERGITATKLNQIQSLAVIQPAFYSTKPSSPTLDPADQILELKGTGAYATITGAQLISSVSASIASSTTRTYNAIQNPTFEVAQRNCRAALVNPVGQNFIEDRWQYGNTGVGAMTFGGVYVIGGAGSGVVVPGTNFIITKASIRVTITTQKASLAAGDGVYLVQTIEGPNFRELSNDVHSLQVLVRSSVANLKFGVFIKDPTGTRSLTKLCTLGAANTFALIQLPNLPVFPGAGTFSLDPGTAGYLFGITLAQGSTATSPANDTWQNGNFGGALGQDNFMASAVNSTYEVFFVQHEPGALCSALIDCPFTENYDDCLKYYQKTYDYAMHPGGGTSNGAMSSIVPANYTQVVCGVPFQKPMAKVPTVTAYSTDGTINAVYDVNSSSSRATGAILAGEKSILQVALATAAPANNLIRYHYTADTGW